VSTFSGLNAASTALWAAQRGLDVTGQNISNVNTAGYSRQRVDQASLGGTAVPALHSVSNNVGSGVSADQITRIRDVFLEARGHVESGRTAQLTTESAAFDQVEAALREPGDDGIQSMLADVWTGWSDLVSNPTKLPSRALVLERMDTLATGFHATRTSLDQQWGQAHDSLAAIVTDVNEATKSIAELNDSIRRASMSNLPTSALSDKRDLLVSQLAGSIGAIGVPGEDGVVDVSLGGIQLVHGGSAIAVELAGADDVDGAAADPPRLVTTIGKTKLETGGTAAGHLTTMTATVPKYRAQLDDLAASLAASMNTAHQAGFDLAGVAGGALFDNGGGAGPITAGNLRLRITDPAALAASAVDPATTGGVAAADGGNADKMFTLSLAADGVDARYRSLVVSLGVESAVSKRDLSVQTVVSDQVDAARESVAGVNLDEEMTNMLSYQHAYSAAARMITAIDEALDTLIHSTGLVGR
jgi:flagellar hook-associated protein 1 FlgK